MGQQFSFAFFCLLEKFDTTRDQLQPSNKFWWLKATSKGNGNFQSKALVKGGTCGCGVNSWICCIGDPHFILIAARIGITRLASILKMNSLSTEKWCASETQECVNYYDWGFFTVPILWSMKTVHPKVAQIMSQMPFFPVNVRGKNN